MLQVTVEIPYIMLHAIIYVAITYPAIGYYWSAYKVFWYFYATLCTFLYFVYLGMFLVSVCPGVEIASVLATAIYTILNLFSGFLLPGPVPSKSISFFLHFMSMHIQGRVINVEFFFIYSENTQVVDLVLLDLPHILVPHWPLDITIWRHEERDIDFWGAQNSWFLSA